MAARAIADTTGSSAVEPPSCQAQPQLAQEDEPTPSGNQIQRGKDRQQVAVIFLPAQAHEDRIQAGKEEQNSDQTSLHRGDLQSTAEDQTQDG